jgi:uncharacterized membrane protein YhaH (DUF805 family)
VIARLVAEARRTPPRFWALYAVIAVAGIVPAALWRPHLVPFGVTMVVVFLLVNLAFPARPPTRHRTKRPGTEHLAE